MEKSIHSHLFAALVSTKEQRLAFMAPEKPEDHDTLEQQIEKDLKDPSKDQADIQKRIDELQGSKHLTAGSNIADWTELREKANKRNQEIETLKKVQKMSTVEDADWKKIEDGIKDKADAPDAAAVELAKDKIIFALGEIAKIADPSTRPHNAVAQTQAYNDLITKIQALDPDNKITFVPNGLGGTEDDKMLEDAKKAKEVTFQPGGAIATAVENFDKPNQLPQTKEIAKQALIDAVKDRKEELWAEMSAVVTNDPQVVDSQKIVQEYLDQIKEIVKLQNEKINGVPPATPASLDTNNVPATKMEGKVENDKITITVEPKDAQIKVTRPDGSVKVEKATGGTLVIEKAPNGDYKFESGGSTFTAKIDIKTGASNTVSEATDKEKTQLEKLLAFFKELIDFLRGESVKNGDLGALRAEVQSIDEQIAKIKKDTPDFDKKPEVQKQITDLEVRRNELQLKIDQGTKITNRVVTDAERFISSSPSQLFVRTGKDRQGNAFLACTKNTPEARGHLSYMTGRLQQIHPGLGFNQQAAGGNQRVSFHFHGDVNINSKNTTDNSRTVTNTVSGINNTGSATADGANTQEQFGGIGVAQDSSARNRARLTPDAPVQPAPVPQPRRARIVDVPPPTGNLS